MDESEKRFSETIQCGHCGNSAPMETLWTHSEDRSDHDPTTGYRWEASDNYELLRCPACSKITLRSYSWHEGMEPSEVACQVLYPSPQHGPAGLPLAIRQAHEAANRVRNIDANAYGVLIGRLLELVCQEREAEGGTLAEKLAYLASKGEIPRNLVTAAASLRQFRNVGAHALLGELTRNDVPMLDSLCTAILEYIYSAPYLADRATGLLRQKHEAEKEGRQTGEASAEGNTGT